MGPKERIRFLIKYYLIEATVIIETKWANLTKQYLKKMPKIKYQVGSIKKKVML